MKWNASSKQTETGEVRFHYTPLTPLKNKIKATPPPRDTLAQSKKMISVNANFNCDLISLFHATGDFRNRSKWFDGVKKVEVLSHSLPRIGMKGRKYTASGESVFYSSSYSYTDTVIEFSEKEENSSEVLNFVLEKINENLSSCTINYYIKNSLPQVITFNLLRKEPIKRGLQKSISNLEKFMSTFEKNVSQIPVQE
jgi:hypothetical protein